MSITTTTRHLHELPEADWNGYLAAHPHASVYFHPSFGRAVSRAYHLPHRYLTAHDASATLRGVLPLFKVGGGVLPSSLVSLPYCDYGGLLASDASGAVALMEQALLAAQALQTPRIILRQTCDLMESYPAIADTIRSAGWHWNVTTQKVQMFLELPSNTDHLFKGFPAKLRSQIRKPHKEGCVCRQGGEELLDDFYRVWALNMRQLGSPAHSRRLMRELVRGHSSATRLFVVYHNATAIAASLTAGFRETLVNPWASFNKEYRNLAPNMLLYWEMLTYAINEGYTRFDFGRSTHGEGTYRFKEQWGARPHQLYWYTLHRTLPRTESRETESKKRALFIALWRRLPLPMTVLLGPIIRKQISL